MARGAKPSFIESVLGKRRARTKGLSTGEANADEDNIVAKVETKEMDDDGLLIFDEDKKKGRKEKRQKSKDQEGELP